VNDAAAAIADYVARRGVSATPLIIGVAGGVAVGKTAVAEALRSAFGESLVDVVATDGFLFPNGVLLARGLAARKGFPESYDVAALRDFLTAARANELPCRVPRYSHITYDVEGTREVPRVDVLVVEGVNVLSAAADLLDVGVYVDAAEPDVERWYEQRFFALCAEARDDPQSFYRSFASMNESEQAAVADEVWRGVNLPNLRDHIAPSAARADLVITKGPDHAVRTVATRDDGAP
jgi:type I pantothenate kinase